MRNVFIKESPPANQNGVEGPNQGRISGEESIPPKNGPSIKPIPNVAPMRPNVFARSFGAVMSAMAACAIAMLPPVIPSMIREIKRSGMLAKSTPTPKRRCPSPVPKIDMPSSGLRPCMSDNCPSIGALKNIKSG